MTSKLTSRVSIIKPGQTSLLVCQQWFASAPSKYAGAVKKNMKIYLFAKGNQSEFVVSFNLF